MGERLKRKARVSGGWTPSNWAGWKPFGIGEQRPNNFFEILRAIRENRDQLGFAWRILKHGVCDGCALGTSGLSDWTLPGIHLCNIRLRLLRMNTQGPLPLERLADVEALRQLPGSELRNLGRLARPMIRHRGDPGFKTIDWDDALDRVAEFIRRTSPKRVGFYLTSRGMYNEAYYCAQKAARAIGTNNVDNAARVCHASSTVALKEALGVGASTCSYEDWLETDLLVFIGSNPANNQPVATKYIHFAKKNGCRIVTINSFREPGMERYWIPSLVESAIFGTRITDKFFLIRTGSDIAFLNGTLRCLIEEGAVNQSFVHHHTSGFPELKSAVQKQTWEELEEQTGVSRNEMLEFSRLLSRSRSAIFVWSMGITQHKFGVENVRSIINLAMAGGFVGRESCGLMPIRGHSGVQGGTEMGCSSNAFPGGLPVNEKYAKELSNRYGFEVPDWPGLTAPELIEAASQGGLDVLLAAGGNFLEVLPDPEFVEGAIGQIPLRVHQDLVLSSQMLVEPAEHVLLLPASTRYETPGGVTETSTERRVILSPEIPGRRIGQARPEWEIFLDLARRVRPELSEKLSFAGPGAVRQEIASIIPFYQGIESLKEFGDQFQYGGRLLCRDGDFPTPNGKARFIPVSLPSGHLSREQFKVSTRRGKQFNSMVHEAHDSLTGAGRDAVMMNPEDAAAVGLAEGDAVELCAGDKTFEGRVHLAQVMRGCLQIHWPEGNGLLSPSQPRSAAGVPDYNIVVKLRRIGPHSARGENIR